MDTKYIDFTIGKVKRIALIAHDGKKHELIKWYEHNKEILQKHFLCGTGTTAKMISDQTLLPVKGYNSGPLGGDQQIGAKIVEAQPHDPDIRALLRIAQVYDIPIANNKASADFIITSKFMDREYVHSVVNFKAQIQQRSETL